ncbi:MAG TPA: NAD(P)/FAD-dependent oxidoreductase [Nocardioides sp.]|nr:NAD(P)/FAD-dependent oxidoreductase [Nocardioides sp.]
MTQDGSPDAVVIGAGPNGLVAANMLADHGWSVLLLEAQPEVGGAVRSDSEVQAGFVHDTFSAFYPLAAASATIRALRLEEHGLRWAHAPAVLGHVLPDGGWALLHRDRGVTAAGFEAQCAGDGEAWLDLCATWDRIGDPLLSMLLRPFPPVFPALGLLTRLRGAGGLPLVRDLLSPASSLGRNLFRGPAPRRLLAGNAGHADIPLDSPGSGLMALLMTMLGQTVGFPAPVGGAGALSAALAARFTALGGEVRCDAEVRRVVVDRGRATGVVLADGERIGVRRAVVADIAAPRLFGGLVEQGDLPARVARGMRRFELDPATIKVDWALSGPVPWNRAPAWAPGTVHLGGARDPDPLVLVGQMTTTDPTRSPAGTESLWSYTHVPQGGDWDAGSCERFADDLQARLETQAPGLASRVLARRVLGPRELEARNANLVGGSIGGGTAQLHQQLVFRPVPGAGRAETGITGLYLGSSSAHPGGGVHGACGSNAARAAVLHDRLHHLTPRLTPWRTR